MRARAPGRARMWGWDGMGCPKRAPGFPFTAPEWIQRRSIPVPASAPPLCKAAQPQFCHHCHVFPLQGHNRSSAPPSPAATSPVCTFFLRFPWMQTGPGWCCPWHPAAFQRGLLHLSHVNRCSQPDLPPSLFFHPQNHKKKKNKIKNEAILAPGTLSTFKPCEKKKR